VTVIIFIYQLLVSYVGQGLRLSRIPAEARVAVKGTFTEALNEVSLTEVQIILAIIIVHSSSAEKRRFHFSTQVSINF
jgi:hypothetical protein